MKKSTILFDMDGTLVPFVNDDFIKLYFKGLTKKLAPLGYEPKKTIDDIWAGTAMMIKNDGFRLNSEVFWETFRARNPEKPDAKPFCDDFYENEFDEAKAALREARDLRPMINRLKNAGFELILSSNPVFPLSAMKTRLKWVNLDESDFLLVTNYDNSTFCKPNPKYFAEILEKAGKKPDECVVVGNSVKEDILPAKSLGLETFWVTDYPENPDNTDVSSFDKGSMASAEEFLLGLA